MEKKHAYCIVAHNEPEVFAKLVSLIDDERNDIYVMIDKKSDIAHFNHVSTQYSNLVFVDERLDVRWGDLSMVEAELKLFEIANRTLEYSYLHLLSGVDLPIKSQDYIHSFTEENERCEYVDIAYDRLNAKDAERKTRYHHIFCRYFNDKNFFKRFASRIIRKIVLMFQQIIGFRRDYDGMIIMKGSQWVSISGDFCRYLIEKKEWILRKFRNVPAADEIFIQTIIYNSPFKNRIWKGGENESTNMRAIDWARGNPYVWDKSDLPELFNSNMWFARKFTAKFFYEI